VANVDLSIYPIDSTYCVCQEGFFWQSVADPITNTDANICQDCATADITTCNQCKNHVGKTDATTGAFVCTACSMIDSTNGTYNVINGGCNCQLGYTWEAATSSCILCSAATIQGECGSETCVGYYFDTGLGQCSLCSNILDTDATVNDAKYGLALCACTVDLTWVDGVGAAGSCQTCASVTAPSDLTCESATCPNWLFDNNAGVCTQLCSAAGQGVIDPFSSMVDGECACQIGFFWDSVARECVVCLKSTN
jgi:hypothetical protein